MDIVVGDNSFVGADDVSGVFVMWIGILNKYMQVEILKFKKNHPGGRLIYSSI